jgi:hypothetical protein
MMSQLMHFFLKNYIHLLADFMLFFEFLEPRLSTPTTLEFLLITFFDVLALSDLFCFVNKLHASKNFGTNLN